MPGKFSFPRYYSAKKYFLRDYRFSYDWFSHNIPVWRRLLDHLKGKPRVQYLEIGAFEGRSAIWMLENILTHPTSRMTCIDTFAQGTKDTFLHNLRLSRAEGKASVITGPSQEELAKLPSNSFHVAYVDGSHEAEDTFQDAILSFKLLKPGGILIFDDYWLQATVQPPPQSRPEVAIDKFLATVKNRRILHFGYQVIVRKTKSPWARLV